MPLHHPQTNADIVVVTTTSTPLDALLASAVHALKDGVSKIRLQNRDATADVFWHYGSDEPATTDMARLQPGEWVEFDWPTKSYKSLRLRTPSGTVKVYVVQEHIR